MPEFIIGLWQTALKVRIVQPAFHYHCVSREFEATPGILFSLLPVILSLFFFFPCAHHFEYFPGSFPSSWDSRRRSISWGGSEKWCCRDLNATDAMLQNAFKPSFALSSFSHLSVLNSSSVLFTVTEAVSLYVGQKIFQQQEKDLEKCVQNHRGFIQLH